MNLDEYKLGNPNDDGTGSIMVSDCCGSDIVEGELSNCCGATFWASDICNDCREHADREEVCCGECGDMCSEIEEYEYKEQQRESAEESARDGEKDEN